MSQYSIRVANGRDPDESNFRFPAAFLPGGTHIYVAFSNFGYWMYFGSLPHYVSPVMNFDGNDVVELLYEVCPMRRDSLCTSSTALR